jgi:AcrR family transcriptional regulator
MHAENDLAQREASRRLLEAASEEFAKHGYAGARIRHIVDAARVNLAAVNYYFGGKEGLYRATLKFLAGQATPVVDREDLSPERRLRRHIFALLERFVGADRPSTLGRILVHEFMHPARGGESVFAETLEVELERVRGALRQIAGPDVPESDIQHAALGVLGQCVLYLYARNPDSGRGRDFCKSVARRITAFSLGGLERLRAPVSGE